MEEIKIFKIKDSKTGLFSTGGMFPSWTKKGKTWSAKQHVKSHLKQFIDDEKWKKEWVNKIPSSWKIVEISSINGIKEYSARNQYSTKNIYLKDE